MNDFVFSGPVKIYVESQHVICKSINSPRLQVVTEYEWQQTWSSNHGFTISRFLLMWQIAGGSAEKASKMTYQSEYLFFFSHPLNQCGLNFGSQENENSVIISFFNWFFSFFRRPKKEKRCCAWCYSFPYNKSERWPGDVTLPKKTPWKYQNCVSHDPCTIFIVFWNHIEGCLE